MNDRGLNEAEHEQISTSLEVEQIGVNEFRSKSLWLPLRARGVFGGQIIGQGLVAATSCVDSSFALHAFVACGSLPITRAIYAALLTEEAQSYFLTSSSPSIPIIYNVERLRDGKSYVTCSVKAMQKGKVIFTMLCSFQKPELHQPAFQWPMPEVRPPEECDDEEVRYLRVINDPNSNRDLVKYFQERLIERSRNPIGIKTAKVHHVNEDGTLRYMYWMKARDTPHYDGPFQKCILAYISDLHFISAASRMLGMMKGGKGKEALSMTSTLDHSVWFYENDFNAGEWLLYEMDCPRGGSGRGIVIGRLFTRGGTLLAVASQEGVIRANVRRPDAPESPPKL